MKKDNKKKLFYIALVIIVLIIIANLIFCLLGGYTGGAKYDKQITKPETKAIVDA